MDKDTKDTLKVFGGFFLGGWILKQLLDGKDQYGCPNCGYPLLRSQNSCPRCGQIIKWK